MKYYYFLNKQNSIVHLIKKPTGKYQNIHLALSLFNLTRKVSFIQLLLKNVKKEKHR